MGSCKAGRLHWHYRWSWERRSREAGRGRGAASGCHLEGRRKQHCVEQAGPWQSGASSTEERERKGGRRGARWAKVAASDLVPGDAGEHPLCQLSANHLHPQQRKVSKVRPPLLHPAHRSHESHMIRGHGHMTHSGVITLFHSMSLSFSLYMRPSISRLSTWRDSCQRSSGVRGQRSKSKDQRALTGRWIMRRQRLHAS